MKLPQKQQAGVQRLAQMPTGAAAAAAQSEMGAIKSMSGALEQAGEATTEVADMMINRNLIKFSSKFSEYSDYLDATSSSSVYTNVEDLPEEIRDTLTGGSTITTYMGEGDERVESKMVPTALIAPEYNAYLRNKQAEEYSKEIGSDVHATRALAKTKELIGDMYVRDSKLKGAKLKKIMLSEVLEDAREKVRTGNAGGAIALVKMTAAIEEEDKAVLIESLKQQGLEREVDELIQEGNLANMIAERDRLADVDNFDNGKVYEETRDSGKRLQERKRLDAAISTRKAGAKTKMTGEFKDWQAAVRDGNADPDDPQMKALAKALGLEGEWKNTRGYGKITAAYGDSSAAEAKAFTLISDTALEGRKDYRQKALDNDAVVKAKEERRKELYSDDGDKASYIIKYNETVSDAYTNFEKALASGNPLMMTGAWSEYTSLTKADQIRKGVMPDNVKYLPENSPIVDFVKTIVSKGSAEERQKAVNKVTQIFGDSAGNVALELADDVPEFAGAVFTNKYDRVASEQILAGVDVEHTIDKGKFTDNFNAYTQGVILGTGAKNQMQTVMSHYLGNPENDREDLDRDAHDASMSALMGERVEGYSSSGVPVMTYRMTNGKFKSSSDFKDLLETVNTNMLEAAGQEHMYVGGQRQNPQEVLEIGTLVQVSNGKYRIQIPSSSIESLDAESQLAADGYVSNADGSPYLLDFNELDRVQAFIDTTTEDQEAAAEAQRAKEENERIWAESAERVRKRKAAGRRTRI